MKDTPDSSADGKRFAVIRKYEPTRIEHELLAQVFEVISGRCLGCDELGQPAMSTTNDTPEVAVEATTERNLNRVDNTQRDALEPAA